ncbi:MAG: hypothetical protein QGH37_32465, partial [Candidatus Poribacteria bacterium]|nr:hypothetical protein [Candidatus Poribacteria bacterium]
MQTLMLTGESWGDYPALRSDPSFSTPSFLPAKTHKVPFSAPCCPQSATCQRISPNRILDLACICSRY